MLLSKTGLVFKNDISVRMLLVRLTFFDVGGTLFGERDVYRTQG